MGIRRLGIGANSVFSLSLELCLTCVDELCHLARLLASGCLYMTNLMSEVFQSLCVVRRIYLCTFFKRRSISVRVTFLAVKTSLHVYAPQNTLDGCKDFRLLVLVKRNVIYYQAHYCSPFRLHFSNICVLLFRLPL